MKSDRNIGINMVLNIKKNRATNRVGDVYCVEIDGNYKSYFHYVCKDSSDLNSALIKGFRERYPMDYNPDINEILAGETAFYIHTFIKVGILDNVWYKVGHKNISKEEESIIAELVFGNISEVYYIHGEVIDVAPLSNWTIFKPNGVGKEIGYLPPNLWDSIIEGAVHPYLSILELFKYGYHKCTMCEFEIIKRRPWPDVHSYTRRIVGESIRYYHFYGENIVQEIIVFNGETFKLDKTNPFSRHFPLEDFKFWEVNWTHRKYEDKTQIFIEEEEFNELWND